jgi:hypothetical protein
MEDYKNELELAKRRIEQLERQELEYERVNNDLKIKNQEIIE